MEDRMKNKEWKVAEIKRKINAGVTVTATLNQKQKKELAFIAKITPKKVKIYLDFPKNFFMEKSTPNFIKELYSISKRNKGMHRDRGGRYIYHKVLNPDQKEACRNYHLRVYDSEYEITSLKIEAQKTMRKKTGKRTKRAKK